MSKYNAYKYNAYHGKKSKCAISRPACSPEPCKPVCPPACEIQTKKFKNPTRIAIPPSGQATPYPSSIEVSGMTGKIIKVTVKLINFSHTEPRDVDIMLVGPSGQNATIMSDVGNRDTVSDLILVLDDLALTALPNTDNLVSGTFKPANYEDITGTTNDPFPGAPPPTGGSMLSSFNFTDPNGIWSLYVFDDNGGEEGSIGGGWELTITTSNCTP